MVDSISVKLDGSYEHHVWAGQKNVLSERGHWAKGQYPDGSVAIGFEQFTLFGPPYNKLSLRPGFWLAPVDTDRRGQIILVVNRDVRLSYSKTNDADIN